MDPEATAPSARPSSSERVVDASPTRLTHIDVAKGIGILLVVIGHADPSPVAGTLIYLFHMPLFFIISGYLYRETTLADFVRRKSIRYLLPYVSYLLIFAAAAPQPHMDTILSGWGSSHRGLALLIGGEHLQTFATPFWFPTVLYLTALLATGLAVIKARGAALAIAAACVVAAYLDQRHHTIIWPLAANVALMGYAFFYCGRQMKKLDLTAPVLGIAAAITLIGAGAALLSAVPLSFDMKHAYYGVFPISMIIAVAMSVLTLALSRVVYQRIPKVAQALIYVGQASMTIMYLHQYFQLRVGYTRFHDWHLLRIAAGILIPLALHAVFVRVGPLRFLFCGLTKAERA